MGKNRSAENPEQRTRATPLLFLAALLPAIVAYGLLYFEAYSVPYQDDYAVILAFATEYQQLPTLRAKILDVATKQNNDYKLAFEHSIVAAEMELTGHLNFSFLICLGDLFLLPVAYLLWHIYRPEEIDLNRRLIEFIPMSILFFSLTYWQSLNWAMAGLQNLPVILFSFLAIRLVIPKGSAPPTWPFLFLGCLSAVLAAFSSANGFLLAPIGAVILLSRRSVAHALVWCASFTVPLATYLYHYTPYQVSVHEMHHASFVHKVFYLLAFMGCAIPFHWPAALLGIVISAVIFLALYSRVDRTHPIPFYCTVWIVATAFLVAWLRGGIASRYSIYSLLLLIFCYSFLLQYLPSHSTAFTRRRVYATSVALAIALCLVGDLAAHKHLSAQRRMVQTGMERYRDSPEVNSPMINPEVIAVAPEEAAFERDTLTRAIQNHIYTLPQKP
jgi:hypothetical protein